MDFASLISNATNGADSSMGDLLQAGGNAALGYIEGQAVAAIQADQNKNQAAAQATIQKQLAKPGTPGGIGSYLSSLFKGAALQQYGGSMILAVVAIGVFGYILLKK